MTYIPQNQNDMDRWLIEEAERWDYEQTKERQDRFTPPEEKPDGPEQTERAVPPF